MIRKLLRPGKETDETPKRGDLKDTIATRTEELAPVLQKWRDENRGVPWSFLLSDALKRHPELRRLAGKRHAHLMLCEDSKA